MRGRSIYNFLDDFIDDPCTSWSFLENKKEPPFPYIENLPEEIFITPVLLDKSFKKIVKEYEKVKVSKVEIENKQYKVYRIITKVGDVFYLLWGGDCFEEYGLTSEYEMVFLNTKTGYSSTNLFIY